jgi:D-galactarolactone cycloisomerase
MWAQTCSSQERLVGYHKFQMGEGTGESGRNRFLPVRDAVEPGVKIMLDVNQGWDMATTIKASNKLYDLDITWLEDPLHWYDDQESP